jgi:site-specific recombinase XerD
MKASTDPGSYGNIPQVEDEFICRFEAYLKNRGHSDSTRQVYLSSAKHFYSWLAETPWNENKISKEIVQHFLEDHLPACCCPGPVSKSLKNIRAALNQVLLMEGCPRIRPKHGVTSLNIEVEIENFDAYLQNICGHSEATRWYRRRIIKEFLIWLFGDQCICVDRITAGSLCRFVLEKSASLSTSSMGTVVCALRAYLRFLQLNGYVSLSLAATIPKPAGISGSNLPHALTRQELIKFWTVFDLKSPIGKRDYAMARCLVDLGLRCHEVADIQLDDIDWHGCVLRLSKTKSRRQETLPIPEKMGHALVVYLRGARPQTRSRSVFVYHRAPVGQAVQKTTVRGVVRRAFARAGLPWSGTHILRSTVASLLLENGASVKEVADVLRHRSIDTTKIYARINLIQLAKVALPWPGRLP